MYFHCIVDYKIVSNVFVALFDFIVTTSVQYLPKMEHPVPMCLITGQAYPSLPDDKHGTEGFDLSKPRFYPKLQNLVASCDCAFRSNLRRNIFNFIKSL